MGQVRHTIIEKYFFISTIINNMFALFPVPRKLAHYLSPHNKVIPRLKNLLANNFFKPKHNYSLYNVHHPLYSRQIEMTPLSPTCEGIF